MQWYHAAIELSWGDTKRERVLGLARRRRYKYISATCYVLAQSCSFELTRIYRAQPR